MNLNGTKLGQERTRPRTILMWTKYFQWKFPELDSRDLRGRCVLTSNTRKNEVLPQVLSQVSFVCSSSLYI